MRTLVRTTAGVALAATIGVEVARAAEPSANAAIEIWYGDEQHFGRLGNPQPRINILGSVAPSANVAALSFALNGGPRQPLTIGPDLRRLARAGDFNIEIERSDLKDGINDVVIVARIREGSDIRRQVRIHYTPGRAWPLPYTLRWSQARRLDEVVEIMDGRWTLTPDGARILEPYYDRVLLLGDATWQDYDVLTSVIFHRLQAEETAPRTPPFANHAHASLLLRWGGHPDDGKQPRTQWRPTGGLAMWRADAGVEGIQWVWHGGESGILATESRRRPVELGQRYMIRARVETLPGPKTRYSVRSWERGRPEPAQWDLVAVDGERDLQSGSVALVTHHGDVTFGDVEVRPLNKPPAAPP